jgi:O-antigen ligase
MKQLPIWTPLAAVLLALAWVIPNASPPWVAFHKDAWAALVFLLVALVLVFRRHPAPLNMQLDALALVLVCAALFPLLQWSLGIVYFFGHALMGFVYFGAAALALVLGRAWEQREPGRPGEFLFWALWLAAMVTSGIMLAQWLRLDVNEVWIQQLPTDGRPFGNLIQPNNAATLLLLGIAALNWFAIQGRLRRGPAWLGVVYLSFFLVLTGSRIGYLSFLILALGGLCVGLRQPDFRSWRPVYIAMLVLLPAFRYVISFDWGSVAIETEGARPLVLTASNVRTLVYQAYLEAALTKPWLGFGFEQGAQTQLAAYALGHELPVLFTWSHNAFLDLATWFGLPLALAAIVAVSACAVAVFRAPFDSRRSIYLASVFVVFAHGMVELPLAYAYFLLPACLLAGAMTATLRWPAMRVPLIVPRALVLTMAVLLGGITHDYLRVESAFYTWRFMNNKVGKNHPMDVPDTLLLNQYSALLTGLRGSAETLTDLELLRFEEAIFLDPSAAGMQKLAELQLKRGDIADAQRTADMAHVLAPGEMRTRLAARWNYLGTIDPAYLAVTWRAK